MYREVWRGEERYREIQDTERYWEVLTKANSSL